MEFLVNVDTKDVSHCILNPHSTPQPKMALTILHQTFYVNLINNYFNHYTFPNKFSFISREKEMSHKPDQT